MVFAKFICIAHLKNKAVQNALRKTFTCKDTIIAHRGVSRSVY